MTTEQLKEYLDIVVDMEKNIYFQEKTILRLSAEANRLGIATELHECSEPIKPQRREIANNSMLSAIKAFGITWAIILLMVAPCIFFSPGSYTIVIAGVLPAGLPLSLIISVCTLMRKYSDYKHALKQNEKEYNHCILAYQEKVNEYQIRQREIALDRERVKEELVKKSVISSNIEKLKNQNIKSKETLSKIYDKNIIFPKYRNLVMVCSIYEYFCAGRCNALEGHEGAYNILEMELRMDRIITRLDVVISKLDQIRSNQFMLYTAIQESNQRSAQILESSNRMADQLQSMGSRIEIQSAQFQAQLADLQKSSALTAYHAERTQKELAYMNRMDYLTGRNDGVFFNLPPT